MQPKQVTIGGKVYPAVWNMAAYMEMAQRMNLTIDNVAGDDIDPATLYRILHLALKFGAEESRQRFSMTYGEFCELAFDFPDDIGNMALALKDDFVAVTRRVVERAKKNNVNTPEVQAVEERLRELE